MNVLRIAAFSRENEGGNPAGVVICEEMPSDASMLRIANEVGYSETAFLHRYQDGWRIRYFAPDIEVPFCGHATIAAGLALGDRLGDGRYRLILNAAEVSIEVERTSTGRVRVALQSPATSSAAAPSAYINDVVQMFNFDLDDIHPDFPVSFAAAGARHLLVVLKDRDVLAKMEYDFEPTRQLMLKENLATISLLWQESQGRFHSRNPFAAGGVYEDPATGAAAAALAGYLRDIGWRGNQEFEIIQGEDMGCPSCLLVAYSTVPGESVNVAGEARLIS